MWAENFARSQVEYNMPVDVLTAASSNSLDPFAEGPCDSVRPYTLGVPHHTGTGDDVVLAALAHRMHDDSLHNYTSCNKEVKDSVGEGNLTVVVQGNNVFGTTVSKSFARRNKHGDLIGAYTVNISIASYRVVESKKHGKYAQFLVIYREGSIRDTVGIW